MQPIRFEVLVVTYGAGTSAAAVAPSEELPNAAVTRQLFVSLTRSDVDRWEARVTVRGAASALFKTGLFVRCCSLSGVVARFTTLLFKSNCTQRSWIKSALMNRFQFWHNRTLTEHPSESIHFKDLSIY